MQTIYCDNRLPKKTFQSIKFPYHLHLFLLIFFTPVTLLLRLASLIRAGDMLGWPQAFQQWSNKLSSKNRKRCEKKLYMQISLRYLCFHTSFSHAFANSQKWVFHWNIYLVVKYIKCIETVRIVLLLALVMFCLKRAYNSVNWIQSSIRIHIYNSSASAHILNTMRIWLNHFACLCLECV